MIRFFRKLFKRGDFMTRADKAYYKYRAKTIFWSAFCLIIISWVGTNLVLCALTTNVESGGDIIYEAPVHDVVLPTGIELSAAMRGLDEVDYEFDYTIQTVTFDYIDNYDDSDNNGTPDLFEGAEKNVLSVQDNICVFRVNDGADVFVLSRNNMLANPDSSLTFAGFQSLKSVDFKNFQVTNIVTSIWQIFFECPQIAELDIQGWDTSGVTDFSDAFSYCDTLTQIKGIENLDLSSAHILGAMFEDDYSLSFLDLSGWDTRNVAGMDAMFKSCSSLTTIYVSDNFVTTNVWADREMFYNCEKLVGGQGTIYDAKHTNKEYARIDGGPSSSTPGYFTAK